MPASDRSRTFSPAHLEKQRAAHRAADGYGRHRHNYLPPRMVAVASALAETRPKGVTWLDYGCGKGTFIEQIRPIFPFAAISGYDPGVKQFSVRPAGPCDLVTCLDVIDIVEPGYVGAVIEDVRALTGGLALFDVLTRPLKLPPHPPYYWTTLVQRHMRVVEHCVEFAGMDRLERVLILAAPPV